MSTPPTPSQPKKSAVQLSGKGITAIVILALALIFVFSNLSDGTLRFLGFQFTMPVWIWFLGVLVAGVIVGSLFPWLMPKKKKKQ